MRYIVVVLLSALSLAVAFSPAPSSAQAPLQIATPRPTFAPQITESAGSVTPPLDTAPVGDRTRQLLLIIGAVLGILLLLGGGIYLRHWWMANRW